MRRLLIADDSEYLEEITDTLYSITTQIEIIDVDDPKFRPLDANKPSVFMYDPYYILDDRIAAHSVLRRSISYAKTLQFPIIALTNQTEWVLAQEYIEQGRHYDHIISKSSSLDEIADFLKGFLN